MVKVGNATTPHLQAECGVGLQDRVHRLRLRDVLHRRLARADVGPRLGLGLVQLGDVGLDPLLAVGELGLAPLRLGRLRKVKTVKDSERIAQRFSSCHHLCGLHHRRRDHAHE